MILLAVGCSYRNTPVDVRERLAFDADQLAARPRRARPSRYGCEAVILSTCNRVELYLGPASTTAPVGRSTPTLLRRVPRRVPRPAVADDPAAPLRATATPTPCATCSASPPASTA